MSPYVSIFPSGRRLTADFGDLLSDILAKEDIPLNLYCGRRGVCGKCFVEILSGDLPPSDERDQALARAKNLDPSRHRLACRLPVRGDLSIRIPEQALIPKARILSRGTGKEIFLDPTVRKIAVRPSRPDLHSPHALLEGLKTGLGLPGLRLAPETLFSAAAVLSEAPEKDPMVTAVLGVGDELRGVERGDTTSRLFGLAIDLGTTTLAADLVDLGTGTVIGNAAGLNGQSSFGADVVSRISAAFKDPAQAVALRNAVLASINGLISDLRRTTGVEPGEIYETVVAGNTAMNHFFLGLPVDGLAVAPFVGVFSVAPPLPADRTGLRVNPLGRIYLSPNLQSFVGGDITAGVVATDLPSRLGNVLFLDLGTNGELVLKTDRGMTSTSTAAGPAFEGMSVSCGLSAQTGAVDKAVLLEDGTIDVETIGGGPARGVCGSGLVDVIAAYLRRGDLSADGRILRPDKRLPVTPDVSLTSQDVREIQLASAAVKAGMRMLLESAHLGVEELDEVLVAGAFGAYLNVDNAAAIGLLPRLPGGRVKFVGNTSLEGARALLLSGRERLRAESFPRIIRHLPLAQDKAFQQIFVEELSFREWPAGGTPAAAKQEES
ncbi:MAG: ASKHA domain-containing protein [Candidatus Aminicenantes bacterium]|nr:ASKHA domain-containing protein [Candidatus Aminicenantes bacterium]